VLSIWFDEKMSKTLQFSEADPLMKLVYLYGSLRLLMTTYLTGFCLMEVGSIACGLGFNGYEENGNSKFDRIRSCNLLKLETSYRIKDFLANWNISVHDWLKNYVYLRLLDNSKKG